MIYNTQEINFLIQHIKEGNKTINHRKQKRMPLSILPI